MTMALKVVKTKAEEDFAAHFAQVRSKLPGSDKVAELRDDAMARFAHAGLPHRRIEAWKYTDLKAKINTGFQLAPIDDAYEISHGQIDEALGALASLACLRLVFVNGVYSAALSDDIAGAALTVTPLSDALKEGADRFVGDLGTINPPETDDPVLNLNTAFMRDGALMRFEGLVEKPVQLIFVNAGDTPAFIASRNVLNIADGAEVTFLETHLSLAKCAMQSNCVTELNVGDEAQLLHVKVQMDAEEATHLSSWMARLGKEANYRAFQFTLGGAISRNQLFVRFDGEGAKLDISGALMQGGTQHSDTTIIVDHAVPACESRELFKAVLDDEARGVFQAKVVVRRHAQKTDGAQMSQALMLSDTAEFDTKPELEIYADDVVCGHGATSGQIDEELLFYLRARGMPEAEARALLISAFVGEAFEAIDDEDMSAALRALAETWLNRRA